MNKNYPELRHDIQKSLRQLGEKSPGVVKSLGLLHGAVYAPGALETKQKELIALGISIGMRCDDCIAFHIHEALSHGATADEIIETLNVAGPRESEAPGIYAEAGEFLERWVAVQAVRGSGGISTT